MITFPCQKEETRKEDWEEGYEDLNKDERTSIVCAEVPSDQLKLVKSVQYGGQPVLAQQKEMIRIPCQKEETSSRPTEGNDKNSLPKGRDKKRRLGRRIPCQKEETRKED
ncbi:hypothetical protein QE152_g7409 [Popillia japonica]|uniref:Uncharacterized protein n=1 Tax=Popillia japonica TaxID=7064 RepID=A0AAW1MF96_POPJA